MFYEFSQSCVLFSPFLFTLFFPPYSAPSSNEKYPEPSRSFPFPYCHIRAKPICLQFMSAILYISGNKFTGNQSALGATFIPARYLYYLKRL